MYGICNLYFEKQTKVGGAFVSFCFVHATLTPQNPDDPQTLVSESAVAEFCGAIYSGLRYFLLCRIYAMIALPAAVQVPLVGNMSCQFVQVSDFFYSFKGQAPTTKVRLDGYSRQRKSHYVGRR